MIAALAATTWTATAQKTKDSAAPSLAYTLPQTALKVEVELRREVIRSGPYARFAQKYLGVMAPLASKDLYTIADARISARTESDPSRLYLVESAALTPADFLNANGMTVSAPLGIQGAPAGPAAHPQPGALFPGAASRPGMSPPRRSGVEPVSLLSSDTAFVKVQIDRLSPTEKSLEDMAAQAAATIFNLRKRRMELITGEAGENVFGEGLKAALAELSRLESEYVALFMGKQAVITETRSFTIVPEADKTNTIVMRFSPTAGILDDADLSGQPIVLEIKPERADQMSTPVRSPKDTRPVVYTRLPRPVVCRLLDGKREIATSRQSLAQWGPIVEIPFSSK